MGRRFHVEMGLESPVIVEVLEDDGLKAKVRIWEGDASREMELSLQALHGERALCTTQAGSQVLDIRNESDGSRWVVGPHAQARLRVLDERDTWLGAGGGGAGDSVVTVAMPGRVVAVDVEEGDNVERGQRILVIEAMKMENDVKAPRDGCVRAIRVTPGDAVDAGQPLIELE